MSLEIEANTLAELMLAEGRTQMRNHFERCRTGHASQRVIVTVSLEVIEVPATDPDYEAYYDRCEQANRTPLSYAEWQKASRHV
jgi:hypothetical protein